MSEIIILIRWVTPPPKVEIPQIIDILQLCIVFTGSVVFFIGYIYMSLCPLQHSLIAISSSWFSAKWMWSDPSPLCYTQPNLFTNSSCAFYLKLVQNLHCVLVSWRNCERNFKTYLIKIFGFAAQTVPHPTIYLSTHPWSNTTSTSHYVGDTCHANEKGQGHVRPNSSGERFSPWL